MSPEVLHFGHTFLNLLDSSELLHILETLTIVINRKNGNDQDSIQLSHTSHKALTAKLLRQGYRYFKLRKAFWKFYRRHNALVEKI